MAKAKLPQKKDIVKPGREAEAHNMQAAKDRLAFINRQEMKRHEMGVKGLLDFYSKKAAEKGQEDGSFFKVIVKGLPMDTIYAFSEKHAKKLLVKRGVRKFRVVACQ